MGFLNALNGGPKPLMGTPSMLTPEQIQELLDMGIDPETFANSGGLGGVQDQPQTVQDTITQPMDPMVAPAEQIDQNPTPQVSVNPPAGQAHAHNPDGPHWDLDTDGVYRQYFPPGTDMGDTPKREGLFARMLGGLGDNLSMDTPAGQALMATGLGILGAQNTYGNAMSALGQGGTQGMASYSYAKRRQDIDQYKKDQLEAAKEAARSKRIQDVLTTATKLSETQPEAATKMLNANADVLDYLNAKRGEIIYRGKQADPKIHVAESSGRVFAITPDGVKVVGQVDAAPRQGPDPYSGAFTEDVVDPNTGQTMKVRYDKTGKPITVLGAAPTRAGQRVTFNKETGEFTVESGGESVKTSPEVVSRAYDAVDSSDKAIALADRLADSINSNSVGWWSNVQQSTLGSVAQVDAALGQTLSRAISEATPDLERAGIDPGKFFNKDKSTVQALGDLLAIAVQKSAEGASRGLTDVDMRMARERLGLNKGLVSPDDVKYRVGLMREQAVQSGERAAARIAELTGKPPAGRTNMGTKPAAKTREARLAELTAEHGEDQAYKLLAREIVTGQVK